VLKSTLSVLLLLALPATMFAGGPLIVGKDANPFTWDMSRGPIQYRVDGGNLAGTTVVTVDNAGGKQLVQSLFDTWAAAPGTSLGARSAGGILPVAGFSDGDVSNAAEFSAVQNSCNAGAQSPIVFDADGAIFRDLIGDSSVIGFAGPCALDASGHIVSASAALNGLFRDGQTIPGNPEIAPVAFEAAMLHEIGHFLGLDHSQVNVDCLTRGCSADDLDAVPTMFPILITNSARQLSLDDQAWIASLYPSAAFASTYGTISGRILFSDASSAAQGVNVVVRQVDNPATAVNESRTIAVSVVSGYLFTGNPGQSTTAGYLPCIPAQQCPNGFLGNNQGGSDFGSRDAALVGYYQVPVPSGSYTVEVEAVKSSFQGGSSVGPLDPPAPLPGGIQKYWNSTETSHDDPNTRTPVTVTPGSHVQNLDIILNNTDPTFDPYEDPGHALLAPLLPGLQAKERA
jgi:hypothetical protein